VVPKKTFLRIYQPSVDQSPPRASIVQVQHSAGPRLEGKVMQYMLIFQSPLAEFAKANDPKTAPAYFAAWGAYIGAMQGAGVVVNGHGLQPPQMGTTVRVRDGKRVVQDGPYADTKEHLGGYFVIEAASLDIALDWAAKSPSALIGSVEVRPVLPPLPMGK
jgi:hypothetical protein